MWDTIGTSGASFGGISYSIESTAFTDGVPPLGAGTYGNMMQLLRIIECPQRGYPIYRRARDDTEVAEDFYAILTVGTYGTLNGVDSSQLFADPT